MEILITSPIVFSLIMAIVLRALWKKTTLQQIVNIAGSVLMIAVSMILLYQVYHNGILTAQLGNWPAPYGITLVIDTLSSIMICMTAIMSLVISIYSITSMDAKRKRFGYYPLLHLMYMGIYGAFLAGDIFNLFVWFEVMLISSFILLSLGSTKKQLKATLKYVTINMFASIIFLTAVGLLYALTGSLNMADIAVKITYIDEPSLINIVAVLFWISFGIKAAVFPLFFWLPASYHTPPIAITAIFSALLTKVGVYAMIRTFTLIFNGHVEFTQSFILVTAGLTIIVGVLGAVSQSDIRRMLSFLLISHIGFMIMGLGFFTPLAITAVVFYLMHHIIVKANLFLISGIIYHVNGSYQLNRLGGLYKEVPLLGFAFLIPALSLVGIPPFSGFWGKLFLINSGFEIQKYIIVFIGLVAGILTLYCMIKIWSEVFWKKHPGMSPEREKFNLTEYFSTSKGLLLLTPVLFLTSITIIMGLFPEFFYILSQKASSELMNPEQYIKAVLK